jgi:hypothetical protein
MLSRTAQPASSRAGTGSTARRPCVPASPPAAPWTLVVGVSRSERLEKAGTGGGDAGGASGDCRGGNTNVARFGLVTYFKASAAQEAAAAAATPAGPATAVTPAPAAPTTPAPAATAPANQTASTATGGSK